MAAGADAAAAATSIAAAVASAASVDPLPGDRVVLAVVVVVA